MNASPDNLPVELTHKEVSHILFSLVDISEEFDEIDPKKTEGLTVKGLMLLCDRIGYVVDDMEGLKGSPRKQQTTVNLARSDVGDIARCLKASIDRFDDLEPEVTEGYTKEGLLAVASKLLAAVTG